MNITVYCSARNQVGEEYKVLARELGRWIASNGHTLVFGGATGGLMTEVSQSAFEAKGNIIGVITKHIHHSGRLSPYNKETVFVASMSERKQQMRDLADVIICLPGSYGTLDEMMDVIASGTVGEHKKPLFIFNYKGYYTGLQQQIADMKELAFLPQEESYKPNFVETLDELVLCLTSYVLRPNNKQKYTAL